MVIDLRSRPRHGSERHRAHRTGSLRAAVLGADDGIVSTASLILGVAAANGSRAALITAGMAGLAAGALSMAAGEYVSVSSQRDVEHADLQREERELSAAPEAELDELAAIYTQRGLEPDLAHTVAAQLMRHDALAAHARDELNLADETRARPLQAAAASASAFVVGAIVPIIALLVAPSSSRSIVVVVAAVLGLGLLGILGASAGGAGWRRAGLRVIVGGSLAMAVTALIGSIVGTAGL